MDWGDRRHSGDDGVKLRQISEKRFFLAESGLWDGSTQSFYFTDIFAGNLYQYNVETEKLVCHSFDCFVSAAVLHENGCLILATQKGIGIYNPVLKKFTRKVHPNAQLEKVTRYNDCKCDPAGRLYAGTMDLQGRPGCGKLYCINPDWSWKTVLEPVDYSNGLVWLKDRMYYTDTYKGEVYRFSYDIWTGRMKNKEILCTFPPGQPDGMAADYEGNLWIALWGGFGVACVDTDTGHVIRKIEMPMPNVSSICFGGDDGRKVLITTAYKDLTPEGRKKYPQAGTVWFGNIGARGPEFYRCRGGLP